jgi:hypothetical protein
VKNDKQKQKATKTKKRAPCSMGVDLAGDEATKYHSDSPVPVGISFCRF